MTPSKRSRRLVEANPHLAQGFWITTLTAAVSFRTNDAGVVAAATLMLYPVALLLELALEATSTSPRP